MLAVLLAGVGLLVLARDSSAQLLRVALLPVVVHSATPDNAYVSTGLAEMLSARLEQFEGVAVIRVGEESKPTTEAAAVEAARSVGASYVLFGSFTQFGAGASLDLRCAPVDGSNDGRRIFIQAGTMAEIIPRLFFRRGYTNGDDSLDIGDAIFLLNFLFRGDASPVPPEAGDINADGVVDLSDAVYLLEYLFLTGPPPPEPFTVPGPV